MLVQRERRLGSAPRERIWRAKEAAVSASPEEQRRDTSMFMFWEKAVTGQLISSWDCLGSSHDEHKCLLSCRGVCPVLRKVRITYTQARWRRCVYTCSIQLRVYLTLVNTNRCLGPQPCSSSGGGSYLSDRPDHSRRSLSLGSVQRQDEQCVSEDCCCHCANVLHNGP